MTILPHWNRKVLDHLVRLKVSVKMMINDGKMIADNPLNTGYILFY